ncbi:MAG: RNA-directed DNA polymerase, partial [Bdellovibrionaceae bacterium]|nr:RNA-directed DNA polymerase [Pseudobdellovibrionaceae bacterium]
MAKFVADYWPQLEQAASSSKISLTKPVLSDPTRAIARQNSLEVRAGKRAELRSQGRFILLADIVRFYPSAYTHSIPWAFHGKSVSKANRSSRLLGNKLDELIRNCQDGQTNGIPIGPDTSLLIAEILLTQVDRKLTSRRLKGIRYVDDYELVFDTEAEALKALSKLEHALLEYELHLNPAKTNVISLPQRIEDVWVAELKHLELDSLSGNFRSQILRFFDHAFELAHAYPTENVLKYAAGRIANIRSWHEHYEMVEDLLIQCARVEAGTLPLVLRTILHN